MKKTTIAQRRGHATKKARSEERFRVLLEASENGLSIEEASAIAGLTVKGAKGLLYKRTGTERWPTTQNNA